MPVVQEPPCDGAIAEALTAAFAADAEPLVGDVAQTYDLAHLAADGVVMAFVLMS